MSRTERVLSVLLVAHLIAVGTAAFARAPETRRRTPASAPPHGQISRTVAPVLDAVERVETPLLDAAWSVSALPRRVIDRYIYTFGLGQRWGMFANVPEIAEYLKAAYVVSPADGRRGYVVQELIFPAWRTDQFRGLGGFQASYRNKAIETSLSDFWRNELEKRTPNLALQPIADYYAREFARRHLAADERITRAEIWYGFTTNRSPGAPSDEQKRLALEATLDQYAGGPSRCLTCPLPRLSIGTTRNEGPIQWALIVARGE